MNCKICGNSFEPKRKNQSCCSDKCKREKERRYQAEYHKRTGKKRILTDEQKEANRKRARAYYKNMPQGKKEKLLKKMREEYRAKKKKK